MRHIRSIIIPLNRKDVDTDLIIPAQYLTGTSKEGLGKHLFARLRSPLKNKRASQSCPFDHLKYRNAKILVTCENFGCGSSREHAAWALKEWGIEAIIASSFADIFYNNALKNHLLPIVLDEKIVQKILKDSLKSEYEIHIDLPRQKVTLPDKKEYTFEISPYSKECLQKGMDDLDYLIENHSEIEAFEKKHVREIFFTVECI